MKDSLLLIACFVLGLALGFLQYLPEFLLHPSLGTWVLYVLMFVVGVGIGSDTEALQTLRKIDWRMLLLPLAVVLGSIGAALLFAFFMPDLRGLDAVLVASGFGYYSLSSILISEMHSSSLGTVALMANVLRELLTLLSAPVLVLVFGKLAPIAAGGATAMDTTLPVIVRSSGKEYAVLAVFSGVVLTLLVPFLVTFFLSLQ